MASACLTVLLAAAAPGSNASAPTIRLETVARFGTSGIAAAVAVSSGSNRIYVTDGATVREYLLLSPGQVMPSAGAPVPVPADPLAIWSDASSVYVAAADGVYQVSMVQQRVLASYTGFAVMGVTGLADYLYLAVNDSDDNACGLLVTDRSLRPRGVWVELCDEGCCDRYTHQVMDVAVQGKTAYLGIQTCGGIAGGCRGYLTAIDIADPARPYATRYTCELPGLPARVRVSGQRAYVALESTDDGPAQGGALVVVDLAEPLAPRVVGAHGTARPLTGLAVALPYAFVTDDAGRILALDVSDPAVPLLAARGETGFPALDVCVKDANVLVADGQGGLLVLRVVQGAPATPAAGPSATPTPKPLPTATATILPSVTPTPDPWSALDSLRTFLPMIEKP